MLEIGEKVKIGENTYEVTTAKSCELSCAVCSFKKECNRSKAFDALKAKHFALHCVDLIPVRAYFKKVEQSPQVDCK